MRKRVLVAVLALAAFPAAAQDSAGGVVRAPKPVTGEQVYAQVCQACHMADAKGATGAGTRGLGPRRHTYAAYLEKQRGTVTLTAGSRLAFTYSCTRGRAEAARVRL